MSDIYLVRGDTLDLFIDRIQTADGGRYLLSDTDIIYVELKKNPLSSNAVFRKTITAADYEDGRLPISIKPEDTAELPCGDYVFDVRLFMDKEHIYTIIPATKLKLVLNITQIPNT